MGRVLAEEAGRPKATRVRREADFRYRPVTRKGDGDWSQPASIVVV
jgi:hypothetical protein